MTEEFARLPSGVDICFETFGDPADPPVLLVMGLGGPMTWWSVEFCQALVAEGFFVIRYDNRDTGRSSRVRGTRPLRRSQLVRAFFGDRRYAVYTLTDMAEDGFGVLDHLGIQAAHVVGVSMGGMIAQTMAIDHPDRVLSLVSMLSTTGRRAVGYPNPRLFPLLLDRRGAGRDAYIEGSIKAMTAIGSLAYPGDPDRLRRQAEETFDRGWSRGGVVRQMLAILAQPDRTRWLRDLDLPTCVIHGMSDRLVHPSGGRATSRALRGSELLMIDGMAHDLPEQLQETFVRAIVRTARRVSLDRH